MGRYSETLQISFFLPNFHPLDDSCLKSLLPTGALQTNRFHYCFYTYLLAFCARRSCLISCTHLFIVLFTVEWVWNSHFFQGSVSQFRHSVMSDSLQWPWTAACQASLSITNSQRLLKLMSVESAIPSNHLILCRPLFLLPSIFPSIRVFSNESVLCIRWPKYWSFSFSYQSFR